MARYLANARLLLPDGIADRHAVELADGRIAAILPTDAIPAGADSLDLGGALLAPGFLDTQVNGGGGVLFNDAPTVEALEAIASAHRRFGTTGLLPTLISDELDVVRAGIAAVDAAIEAGIPGILGIHIEGPYLNPARHGIHLPEHMRRLDEAGFAAVTGLKHGVTLMTLAPERSSPAMIRRLSDAGLKLSAGHSDASYDEAMAGFDAGIGAVTHLFNAMSPLASRAPGLVGAALDRPDTILALIADGHHVHPASMRVALKAAGPGRIMLVTDAMPFTGAEQADFELQGRHIHYANGALRGPDGQLAGSALDMIGAVRNAAAMLGVGAEAACRMAAEVPARFLGLPMGRIEPGAPANLVALGTGEALEAVFQNGKLQR